MYSFIVDTTLDYLIAHRVICALERRIYGGHVMAWAVFMDGYGFAVALTMCVVMLGFIY